jgi:hypothetical protein
MSICGARYTFTGLNHYGHLTFNEREVQIVLIYTAQSLIAKKSVRIAS